MKNHNGDKMIINVKAYHFEDLQNKLHDSDWLDAELIIKNGNKIQIITLEFWLVEELERLQNWLENISENKFTNKTLDFVDPNLNFKLMKRSNKSVVKAIYKLNGINKIVWELLVTKENFVKLISEIKTTLMKFPCRCGFKHESN
jgi:uncharacterized protein (UPF0128 family)